METTTRFNIEVPDLDRSDSADVPRDVRSVTDAVEICVGYGQGTHALRPAQPYTEAFLYYETDTELHYWSTGAAWKVVGQQFSLSDNSVTNAKMADDSVGAAEIIAGAVGTTELADGSVTAAKISDLLKPSAGAGGGTEALRAIGSGAGNVVAGNDSRLTDTRTPTDGSVTAAKINAALKPSGSAVDATEALRALGTAAGTAAAGNDSRFNAALPATTVAGLGTAVDGKIGYLRLGSSPYTFTPVMYSSTYGKWVTINARDAGLGGNATDSAIVQFSSGGNSGSSGLASILDYKVHVDAGLVLQLQVLGHAFNINNGTKIGAICSHANVGDTITVADDDYWSNPATTDMHTFTATTSLIFDSGWMTATVPSTPKSFLNVQAAGKRNANELRLGTVVYKARWVA